MSDHSTATKGPKQLIVTGLFSFLIPILIIGGLVYTYMSGGQSPYSGLKKCA